jgi:hypothetical protein
VTAKAPANKRVTRVVYAAFITFTAVFVVLLIWEVARQVFAETPLRGAQLSEPCTKGLYDLYAGVDLGMQAGVGLLDADLAVDRYRHARDETWNRKDEIDRKCNADPHWEDAMAALARLDRQAEGIVRRETVELLAVRREVDSFIRVAPQ